MTATATNLKDGMEENDGGGFLMPFEYLVNTC